VRVHELAQAEMVSQRRWQQQPGVVDKPLVVKGYSNPVEPVR